MLAENLSSLSAEQGNELNRIDHGNPAWRALSAFATEQHHAFRHAFDSEPAVETTGQVHHQQETCTTDQVNFTQSADQLSEAERAHAHESRAVQHKTALQAEVDRIQQRIALLNPEKEVVVQLDFISGGASRAASIAVTSSLVIAATVLLAQVIKKFELGSSPYEFSHTVLYKCHAAVAVVCLVILTAAMANLTWHVCVVNKQKKAWWLRRKRICGLHAFEATVQWINLVFYLAPNVYIVYNPCYIETPLIYASGFVQWTCWNTTFMLFLAHAYGGLQRHRVATRDIPAPSLPVHNARRYGELTVDGPLYLLWPCLIPWLLFEANMGYAWLHHLPDGISEATLSCEAGQTTVQCVTDEGTRIGVDIAVALAAAYFAVTYALLWWKLRWFKRMPYAAVKKGIVYFTLQVLALLGKQSTLGALPSKLTIKLWLQLWLRSGVMAYFLLCMVLLWLVNEGTCGSNESIWTGIMPMQVVATINTVVLCYVSTPVNPKQAAAACKLWQVWLQEVAWTEDDKPIKLAARSAMMPNNPKMERQPLFCYETMLKLLYWSCLVYDHDRGNHRAKQSQASPVTDKPAPPVTSSAKTILTLETAMSLYGLTESESFWEVKQDTRCLVSWGGTRVVVAFRGTASMKNALADLQAWRVAHPPARGKVFMGARPLVHVGFLKSWLAGGLNEKVVTAVLKAVQQCRTRLGLSHAITVSVTGHSLGGAMATLAAHDIRTALQAEAIDGVEIICYTFAAPRTGNKAFAKDYNALVPDTWSVTNDQDVVSREGKLIFLYKRPGQRVIVDAIGRLIVRPTHIEAAVQKNAAGQSVKHHLLSSYFHAVLSVALAQFGTNGFVSGMHGIIRLAESSPYIQGCLESQMGMQLAEMKEYSQLDAEQRAQSVLPGSHPPVKGFYLIKPSPLVASAKPLNSSPSLLTKLRHPRCSSTTHSLMPSISTSELGSLSDSQEADVVDTSSGQARRPDLTQSDSSDVVVNIDEAQLKH